MNEVGREQTPHETRDERRLILAGIAGLLGGALLVRRSTVWLALGAALGLLVGRRLGEADGRRERGARRRR